jgi:hypothetical protein
MEHFYEEIALLQQILQQTRFLAEFDWTIAGVG